MPRHLRAAQHREPRQWRDRLVGAAHASIGQAVAPDANQSRQQVRLHRMGDRRVVQNEAASPRLRRPRDLSARRDDVVDLSIAGRHTDGDERSHRPRVERGVRLAERQARHDGGRHVERVCDRARGLAQHRAAAAHTARDREPELNGRNHVHLVDHGLVRPDHERGLGPFPEPHGRPARAGDHPL